MDPTLDLMTLAQFTDLQADMVRRCEAARANRSRQAITPRVSPNTRRLTRRTSRTPRRSRAAKVATVSTTDGGESDPADSDPISPAAINAAIKRLQAAQIAQSENPNLAHRLIVQAIAELAAA